MGKLIRLEFLQIIRETFNLIFLALLIPYMVFGIRELGLDELPLLFYAHQIILWWAMLLGFRKSMEQSSTGFEWLETTKKTGAVLWAKLVSLYLFYALISLLITGFTVWLQQDAMADWLIWESVQLIALYYFTGMLVIGTIGMIIGTKMPSARGYVVCILVGYVLGSVGFGWLARIGSLFPPLVQEFLFKPLRLGIPQHRWAVNTLTGFELASRQWLNRVGLWSLCIGILFWSFRDVHQKSKWQRVPIASIFLLVGTIVAGVLFTGSAPTNVLVERGPHQVEDDYYATPQSPIFADPVFEWNSMAINVDCTKDLRIDVSGTITLHKSMDTLEGQLYHSLKIDTVQLDDIEISFQQIGDRFLLQSNHEIPKGTHELRLTYHGNTPYRYTAGEQGVFLPSFFNWLPVPYRGISVRNDPVLTIPVYNQKEVTYSLQYQGPQPVWSNISSTESTATSDGVALVSGYLETIQKGTPFDFIATWELFPGGAREYVEFLQPELKRLSSFFEVTTPPLHAVVYVPLHSELIGDIGGSSRKTGSILYTHANLPADAVLTADATWRQNQMGDVLYVFLSEFPNFLKQTDEMQSLFVGAMVYRETGLNAEWIQDDRIRSYVTEKPNDEFLRTWFSRMNSHTEFTLPDLYQLIEQGATR